MHYTKEIVLDKTRDQILCCYSVLVRMTIQEVMFVGASLQNHNKFNDFVIFSCFISPANC